MVNLFQGKTRSLITSILFLLFSSTLFGQRDNKIVMSIPFEKFCKYGLVTEEGKKVTLPIYKKISSLSDTLFIATNSKNKKGVISASGQLILPFRYEIITLKYVSKLNSFEAIPQIVANNNFRDFTFDISGKQIISKKDTEPLKGFCGNSDGEPQLDKIFSSKGKYGLIHKEQITAEPVYDTLISVSWGTDYFIAKKGNQFGVLSLYGDTVYRFGNYRFYYDSLIRGLIIIDNKTNLKGLYTQTFLGICNLPCVYEEIGGRIGNQYFLLKEVGKCEYYYDFTRQKKFTE